MPREVVKYLHDIQAACSLIREFVNNKSFDDYQTDALLRSAVERQFEIVGEALRQASFLDETVLEAITHSRDIIAFRNRLIHGYAQVSNELVSGVVERDLPTPRDQVDKLLVS